VKVLAVFTGWQGCSKPCFHEESGKPFGFYRSR